MIDGRFDDGLASLLARRDSEIDAVGARILAATAAVTVALCLGLMLAFG